MRITPAIIIFSIFLIPGGMHAQSNEKTYQNDTIHSGKEYQGGDTSRNGPLQRILKDVQVGVVNGSAGLITPYIAPQIYLSLLNSDEGYYSANQSSFILQHFFSSFRVLTFRFTTVQAERSNSYATGGGTIIRKGSTEIIQIYLALRYRDGRWSITQFNMY